MGLKSISIYLFIVVCLISANATAYDEKVRDVNFPLLNSTKIVLSIDTSSGLKGYTLAEIESIGLKQMETSTYWPEDDGIYQGVLLKDLLKHAGAENCKKITLTALDEYRTEIPKEDWEKWPVLLATRKNGKAMSIRKKGPTRIIYPKYLGGEVAESPMRIRWIWAIKQITPTN